MRSASARPVSPSFSNDRRIPRSGPHRVDRRNDGTPLEARCRRAIDPTRSGWQPPQVSNGAGEASARSGFSTTKTIPSVATGRRRRRRACPALEGDQSGSVQDDKVGCTPIQRRTGIPCATRHSAASAVDIDVQVWPDAGAARNAIGHDPLAGRLRRASRPAPAGATFHERRHPGHPGHRSGPNDFDNNPPERDNPDRAKPGIPDCVILGAWPCTPVLPSRFAPTIRIR